MPIQSYPRTIVQNTGNAQLDQNGLCLMIYNSTTNKYEAATASTFGGGGGGGDATAANQTTQITEAQTTNSLLTSLGSISVANLLESAGGISAADTLDAIFNQNIPNFKWSKWNTYYTKNFNAASGTNTWNLGAAVKIVFNNDNVEISDITDQTGTSVKSFYFDNATTNPIANRNTEIASLGSQSDDLFKDITTVGSVHFTAYYLMTPYIT